MKEAWRRQTTGAVAGGLSLGCRPLRVLALAAGLSACATGPQPDPSDAKAEPEDKPALAASAGALARDREQQARLEPTFYRGTDRQFRPPEPAEPVRFVGEAVSLNFEQAPLEEIVHAILSDILQLDYLVDTPVQGKVTLRTRTPIPRDELLVVLESLLRANNALMIRRDDGRYLVTGSQQGRRLQPRLSSPEDDIAGFSTIIVPLQYISASGMADILKPMADEAAFVRVDNTRNLLMLAGTRAQLDGWLDIVATFDVDLLAGMSVGVFPLENSDVEDTAFAMQELLRAGGGESADLNALVRILPVQRLNSILVVTPRSEYLDRVGTWIERLDADVDARYEPTLHVYPVQNTTAERLAALLNGIYSGGGGGGMAAGAGGAGGRVRPGDAGGTAPGMTPETLGAGRGSAGAGAAAGGGSSPAPIAAAIGGAAERDEFEGVRVVADDENNALMIYATGRQFKIIRKALDQLDVAATQVIIEASILEVTLTDELRYGLEWTFDKDLGRGYTGDALLANAGAGPSAVTPGFSWTVTNPTGNISAVLNALSQDSLINVISTPSVMVLDNHEATIQVGDQVPILQGTTVTNGGNSVQQIEYRDTGVQLSVRPSVNAGGLVTMDIDQSVTDVGNVDSATGQRTFLERSITSRVAVRSSESVVLGGLIRENASAGDSGIPLLHRIPMVGALFGNTTQDSRRTELLVIITPRALYNDEELRAVSDEMRAQVRAMELIRGPAPR